MSGQPHILCVDDEPRVLEGLALTLRRHYRVSTACNAQNGLAIIDGDDPPVVVVSDMRMPEVDGAAFLSRVRERNPDIVRVLLTGQADIDSAIAAINHGQIFRFLTKPCPPQVFVTAVQAAVEQNRLLTAERVLLDQTLRGSVKALMDVLSLSDPLAFGRAVRLKQHVVDLMAALAMPLPWQLEVATMLSQIGCVTLPPGVSEKLYYGKPLNSEESELVRQLPALAVQLIESIPRLEAVRAILQSQERNFDGAGAQPGTPIGESIPFGGRILKIIVEYDRLEASGQPPEAVATGMRERQTRYDPNLLEAFLTAKIKSPRRGFSELPLASLTAGMRLAQDVLATSGLLLVARGQEVTISLLQRLRNMPRGSVREPIHVFAPAESLRT